MFSKKADKELGEEISKDMIHYFYGGTCK